MQKKDRSWLYLAILTLVVAIVWTVVSIVANSRKTTIPPDLEKAISPLNSGINKNIFNTLQERSR